MIEVCGVFLVFVTFFYFFFFLPLCVYRSSQNADDGECDPSNDRTLEKDDSAVDNGHSAVVI